MDTLYGMSDFVTTPNISIVYKEPGNIIQSLCGFIIATQASETNYLELRDVHESNIIPYEYSLASGALDFWKDEEEDIYRHDDG